MLYATKLGAKPSILFRMFLNIIADLTIGAIPLIGDLFDVAWKSNLRNAKLLEKLQENPDKLESKSKIMIWVLFTVLLLLLICVTLFVGWIGIELWKILFN